MDFRMMGGKICMNVSCRTSTTPEWRTGWELRSGGLADLCSQCGAAYENLVYCNRFHSAETGWRDCSLCQKPLHCGCIASKSLYEFLDFGGIGCIGCTKSSQPHVIRNDSVFNGFGGSKISTSGDWHSTGAKNETFSDTVDEGKLLQLCKIMEANESNLFPSAERGDINASSVQTKRGEATHQMREVGPGFSNISLSSIGSLTFAKPENGITTLEVKDMNKSSQPSLSMTLGAPSATPNVLQPLPGGLVDGREQGKTPLSFQQGQKSRPILPKPPKHAVAMSSDDTNGGLPDIRIARPPADGRGKSQLLPRYWPRITDQELQKLSKDLNSTVVPLFEKVLSSSDAGRIGRLVLPKACAEEYFPHIDQSEGLPIRIQDVKGNEWIFQFRFWPNNNSRMYVLEGVTPCIQAMQLEAGDTVTFSRRVPGGRLVMGYRKALKSVDMQDPEHFLLPNGTHGETSGPRDGSLFQTSTGSREPHINSLSEHLQLADGNMNLRRNENNGHRTSEDMLQQPESNSGKKRTRNIGPKSKRLLMHSEDVLELRLTWEDAQELLRPPTSVKPSIVTIDDHDFEEFDEPPVLGKRSLFTASSSRRQEQWAQCDDCSKWRRLPVDVLLPPKWTCSENSWDTSRCSCSAPEEMNQKQLDNLLRACQELKRQRIEKDQNAAQEHEPSGLDALASAAILGDNVGDSGEQSVGETTRHPRHRAGCTCIVCSQPPSGKGHKQNCTCNVCLTVKRRFETMMRRKKRRLSEREAELAQREDSNHKDESEMNGPSIEIGLHTNHSSDNGDSQSRNQADLAESSSTGHIDLNCDPNRADWTYVAPSTLLTIADAVASGTPEPLKSYTKESCLTNMMSEPQAGVGSSLRTQVTDHEN